MAFKPVYILILAATIIIDYVAGIYIEKTVGKHRKLWLVASIVANVGVLCAFKYYNFLNENLTEILSYAHATNPIPYLTILLPIGLSFHTFQAMSYTIEVYRGKQKAERHFGIYSLYVMFYPQLVAGPIERPQNILYQFRQRHRFNIHNISAGLQLIVWGLFKKVVIADRLAVIVNYVYAEPTQFEGFPLIIATVAFAIQIYCDFSGYSDIAIGSAKTLGFSLMENFNRPYFSTSVSEFWKRWHISLSTWFRDYVYIPLGGSRVRKSRLYSNLFITFLLSGLWHGAAWTYIIWGSINGFYLIVENIFVSVFFNVPVLARKIVGWITTFSLICLSWVFFRANSFSDAYYVISHLSNVNDSIMVVLDTNLGSTKYDWSIAIICIVVLFLVEYIQENKIIILSSRIDNAYFRVVTHLVLVVLIILFGVFNTQEQFIYFQF